MRYQATTQFLRQQTVPVEDVVAVRSETPLLAQRVVTERTLLSCHLLRQSVHLEPASTPLTSSRVPQMCCSSSTRRCVRTCSGRRLPRTTSVTRNQSLASTESSRYSWSRTHQAVATNSSSVFLWYVASEEIAASEIVFSFAVRVRSSCRQSKCLFAR